MTSDKIFIKFLSSLGFLKFYEDIAIAKLSWSKSRR